MTLWLILLAWFVLSIAAGLAASRKAVRAPSQARPDGAGEPPANDLPPLSRPAAFVLGFIAWPFVLAFLLFILILFWEFIFYWDEFQDEAKRHAG